LLHSRGYPSVKVLVLSFFFVSRGRGFFPSSSLLFFLETLSFPFSPYPELETTDLNGSPPVRLFFLFLYPLKFVFSAGSIKEVAFNPRPRTRGHRSLSFPPVPIVSTKFFLICSGGLRFTPWILNLVGSFWVPCNSRLW